MTNTTSQEKIGHLIKKIRKRQGLTQKDFAEILGTSQSAVARIESGQQNLTTGKLDTISQKLGRQVISVSDESLDFQITGPNELSGEVTTNTSKNGSVALLCATLLNRQPTTLHGIAQIEAVYRIITVLESIGVTVDWTDDNTVKVTPPDTLDLDSMNEETARKTRSVLMLIGPLAHRRDQFTIPHAGGCKMGERTTSAHEHVFNAFGIDIESKGDHYQVDASSMQAPSQEIVMYEASDTATINALLCATLTKGRTDISFATPNYQVQDICFFLQECGVGVDGVGTHQLSISGQQSIDEPITHHNSEDPIESMMFVSAALTTGSKLTIKRCPIDFLKLELLKLETMGADIERSDTYKADNGKTGLVDLTVRKSDLQALPNKIHALPYPGINTDNLPFFVPIATQAEGKTNILDWMWENRAIYFTELNRLGADITLADPHRVFIDGPTDLKSAQIVCPPALRPSMIILIGMLGADGTSILRNVQSIHRGYEDVARRLNDIGADIEVISDI
jgi:UDP-N-acetylglucosamine 1-carboxyvinyltransferase